MFKKMMIAIAALTLSSPVLAERPAHILYMEVDQGANLLSRQTPSFQRLFEHTGNYLHHENFKLFEEAGAQKSGARSLNEALDLAQKTKRKKLDSVVLVSLKQDIQQVGPKVKDQMIAIARIVDPHTLDVVETLKVKSPMATVKKSQCDRGCQDLIARRHIREILPRFQEALAQKLARIETRPAPVAQKAASNITLSLKGFTPREVRHLEDRLARHESTFDLSSLSSRNNMPVFWLERKKQSGDIRDELSALLGKMDLQARIIETPHNVTLIKVNRDLASLD